MGGPSAAEGNPQRTPNTTLARTRAGAQILVQRREEAPPTPAPPPMSAAALEIRREAAEMSSVLASGWAPPNQEWRSPAAFAGTPGRGVITPGRDLTGRLLASPNASHENSTMSAFGEQRYQL